MKLTACPFKDRLPKFEFQSFNIGTITIAIVPKFKCEPWQFKLRQPKFELQHAEGAVVSLFQVPKIISLFPDIKYYEEAPTTKPLEDIPEDEIPTSTSFTSRSENLKEKRTSRSVLLYSKCNTIDIN